MFVFCFCNLKVSNNLFKLFFLNKSMGVREEVIQKDIDFWLNLSLSLDLRKIRMLELIYQQPYMMNNLSKDLAKIYKSKLSRKTIRRIIDWFEGKGLIKVTKSKPIFVNSIIGLEKDVQRLIIISKERYSLK